MYGPEVRAASDERLPRFPPPPLSPYPRSEPGAGKQGAHGQNRPEDNCYLTQQSIHVKTARVENPPVHKNGLLQVRRECKDLQVLRIILPEKERRSKERLVPGKVGDCTWLAEPGGGKRQEGIQARSG